MTDTAKLEVRERDIPGAIRDFVKRLLALEEIRAILVPQHLPMKRMVMPTLVTDPERLEGVDPLAPAFPMNAAKILSRLTRKPSGARLAAVMRPCEIRAFVELVKLKQANADEVVLISVDCLGAFRNNDYVHFAADDPPGATRRFLETMLNGENPAALGYDLASACKACEFPQSIHADLHIGILGVEGADHVLIEAHTNRGSDLLNKLPFERTQAPPSRKKAVDALIAERSAYRDAMFQQTSAAIATIEKASEYFAACVNCYNCRVACPVCYCKECVFVTDVFAHEPLRYLQWAERKGMIKMPTDTLFYHLTRLTHMSTACVGCGQCSNACPNEIPVMEVFRTVARQTQSSFNYQAGRDLGEAPPLSVFREDEFSEVVGMSRKRAAAK
jgi:formate dehydrogenase (coenzyme F420) beta subunit